MIPALREAMVTALLALALACATADTTPDAGPMVDAAPPMADSAPDAPPCTITWYADDDGDAYGDATRPLVECGGQPDGYVMNATDCDDTTPWRRPSLPEWCDGLDNDCAAGTIESCPAGCVVRTNAGTFYLFCSAAASWSAARTTCIGQSMRPARMDDATENGWVRTTANGTVGTGDFWIGGSDATEGQWRWDDGDQYWQGNQGGAPVGGLYANWVSGEPNNDGEEDCAEVKPAGTWNDVPCTDGQPFVCERYELEP